jgi:hypothetical protein
VERKGRKEEKLYEEKKNDDDKHSTFLEVEENVEK